MSKKRSIAVVCGGYTGEKAISLKSGAMVMNNIDRDQYDPILIVIDRNGWTAHINDQEFLVDKNDFSVATESGKRIFDAAFIAVHGTPGEDGLLQGYFEMIGLPYNTGKVLNMALTFDKFSTVSMLRSGGFKVAESKLLKSPREVNEKKLIDQIGLPCFVKPTNAGSSLGISRVNDVAQLLPSIEKAFAESSHVMVEALVTGTEVTCGVLKIDGKATALQITEIVSYNEFFDYDAKYSEASREEITPARIPEDAFEKCLRTSEEIFDFMDCDGFARIDFILSEKGLYCIEINTVPGMSEVSILPQQCEVYGISKTEMITRILENCF